jgi:hypothetical protein
MLSNKTILFYFFLFPILLCAEGSLSSYQLGYSSNSVKSDIPANAGGLYTGIDFIKTSSSGFGIGLGVVSGNGIYSTLREFYRP